MYRKLSWWVPVLSFLILALPGAALAGPPDGEDGIEPFARDVFVVVGLTLRNPTAETSPDEFLYNDAGLQLFDNAGNAITWGRWTAASATSRASALGGPDGPRTDVRISLTGLVPGGVYSLFWATIGPDSVNPLCPGVERSLALDAVRPADDAPDASSFIADAAGASEFHARVDGDLLAATQFFLSLVYHADGQTYGALPNRGEFLTQGENCRSSYGNDAMRQLLILQKWVV